MLNAALFVKAALPWVLMGLAIAILAANHGKQTDEQQGSRIAMGAGFGLLLGVLLNTCRLWDSHALGFALGPLWGMALGALWKGPEESGDKK